MSQAGRLNTNIPAPGTILTLTGNSGGPVPPTGGNIDVLGDGTIMTVIGNPGTSTLTIYTTAVTSLETDSGTAAVNSNTMTIAGGTGISTSGAGHTVTISTSGSIADTYNGDNGTATPSGGVLNVITGFTSGPYANGTPSFTGSGNTLELAFNDSGSNIGLGINALAGAASIGASGNVAIGNNAGATIAGGNDNMFIGDGSGGSIINGSWNQGTGVGSLEFLTSGQYNLATGYQSGSNLTSNEESNIYFNHPGVTAENNVLRIGAGTGAGAQELNQAFIYGIENVNVGSVASVVTISSDQLGSATITAGAGISVTPTANTITIASTATAGNVVYVNTDPYVVQPTDFLLDVDVSSIPITIQFPDVPTVGASVIVKDWAGQSNVNNITITTVSGGTTIDFNATFVISTAFESIEITGNSQGAYDVSLSYIPSSITFIGDSGSTTPLGGNISFYAGQTAQPTCLGQTVEFRNVSAGVFHLTANGGGGNTNNIFGTGGNVAGSVNSGNGNTGMGHLNLSNIYNSNNNCAFGVNSLATIDTGLLIPANGSNNCAFGFSSLDSLLNGEYNVALGYNAGTSYTTNEASNILISNAGTIGESNVLRIGAGTGSGNQQLAAAYISGINGVNVGSVASVVSISGDQLGSTTITAGANITVTPGANTITIAASSGAVSYNYTSVNHAASPYTAVGTDYYIGADVTAGVISILLPNAPSTGRSFIVKDKVGLAATSNITITTVGGAVNIDGATSFVMNTAYESVSLIFNGASYEVY